MNSEIEMVEVENYDWAVELGKKEFVDLGLSVKWANVNVGAKCPNDKGKYFAWDEVELDEKGRLRGGLCTSRPPPKYPLLRNLRQFLANAWAGCPDPAPAGVALVISMNFYYVLVRPITHRL